ncbi:DUF4865 family protein [Streptacidiphilus sp. PB12-B1b]|uniref:DUF4865 family protein n=1 Tax=Streptacidiphilus sp. PB12-B1b TaxID=2705012 RepID=UPI0015FA9A71|nr:DUF4865 family protein [Streptacidiphilus sp. PB12-B1b]QMU79681.1 DUF4865 family protein [Streptacidiphilus sp. PB12-B1b]
MQAMQYTITLPADYDMSIIRERVRTRGHLLDGFPGLGFKAYLIRERGVDGSPVNAYAPFYLWRDTGGMNRFLWGGGGFGGLVADFGRPAVRSWTTVHEASGPARTRPPVTAIRRLEAVPDGADPAEAVTRARAAAEATAGTPGVHRTLVALDPDRWELVLLTLWAEPAEPAEPEPAGTTDRYRILHLSQGTDES